MKPRDREDRLYSSGKRVKIESEEEILLRFLDTIKPDSYYLDLGCGTGEIAAAARDKGFKVYCSDFSLTALKLAKKEYGLNCILSDFDSGLPFIEESFDVIWVSDVIEHLFDPIFCLEEISKILKRKGVLLIIIPNDLYISNRIKVLFGRSYQYSSYVRFSQYKHHTFFSPYLFEYMLKKNNLRIVKRLNLYKLPRMNMVIRIPGNGSIANLFATTLIYKVIKV